MTGVKGGVSCSCDWPYIQYCELDSCRFWVCRTKAESTVYANSWLSSDFLVIFWVVLTCVKIAVSAGTLIDSIIQTNTASGIICSRCSYLQQGFFLGGGRRLASTRSRGLGDLIWVFGSDIWFCGVNFVVEELNEWFPYRLLICISWKNNYVQYMLLLFLISF